MTIGEEFTGTENLQKYFSDITRILLNERLFDIINIEHTVGNANEEGKYPVDLIVYVTDTNNLLIVPFPEYSSNKGLEVTLKVRDNNFLGAMTPLNISAGYIYNADKENFFTLSIDSDIPVKLFNLYWNINFDHDFYYSPDIESPWYYKNITGVSAEIPVKRATITAGFSESFFLNHENPRRYWNDPAGKTQEGFYMSSNPYISFELPVFF
ncbi:MAG: hypothetical protein FWC21_02560 [Treponema sp.]|nr:hypothetical protein [Treponema sp.]